VDVGNAAAPNSLITSTDLAADGTRNLDFNLTPTSSWPAGTYRVDILVNGVLDQSATYTVE
jgi:outer membrane usher protein FimD/PapC